MSEIVKDLLVRMKNLKEDKIALFRNVHETEQKELAYQKRLSREEARIVQDQNHEIAVLESEAQREEDAEKAKALNAKIKSLYGNVDKRNADIFKRKDQDETYLDYKDNLNKIQLQLKQFKLDLDVKRQEERYLLKEADLVIAELNYEAALKNTQKVAL